MAKQWGTRPILLALSVYHVCKLLTGLPVFSACVHPCLGPKAVASRVVFPRLQLSGAQMGIPIGDLRVC